MFYTVNSPKSLLRRELSLKHRLRQIVKRTLEFRGIFYLYIYLLCMYIHFIIHLGPMYIKCIIIYITYMCKLIQDVING